MAPRNFNDCVRYGNHRRCCGTASSLVVLSISRRVVKKKLPEIPRRRDRAQFEWLESLGHQGYRPFRPLDAAPNQERPARPGHRLPPDPGTTGADDVGHAGLVLEVQEDGAVGALGLLAVGCLLYTSPSPRDRTRSR